MGKPEFFCVSAISRRKETVLTAYRLMRPGVLSATPGMQLRYAALTSEEPGQKSNILHLRALLSEATSFKLSLVGHSFLISKNP